MKLHTFGWKSLFGKAAMASAALGGFLLLGGAPAAKANDGDYDRSAAYSSWRAHEAAEHFGPYSREARYWRRERHEAIERREHVRHEWREHRGYDSGRYHSDWDRR